MQTTPSDEPATGVTHDAPSPAMLRRVAVASCIGSTVEWYDFFIYATASALVFNKLFFPDLSPLVGSLVALGTYAAGFVARPIGGLVFGIIGDQKGRKSALVTTLLMVGIATFLVGLLPTYETIGSLGAIVVELVTLPLFGGLSDRIGRKPVYLFGAAVNLLLVFPTFWVVYAGRQNMIWLALVGTLAVGHSAMYGPQAAFFSELFPTRVRASGISFVQQIGALIGSVGTLGAGWLLALGGGTPWLLCGYIALVALVTLASTAALSETSVRRLGPASRGATVA